MSDKRIVINLAARKTESEWVDTADSFFEFLTPTLFRWTGWAILIGGLQHIHDFSKSGVILILITILSFCALAHIGYYCSRILIIWESKGESRYAKWSERIASAILAIILFVILMFVVRETAAAIADFKENSTEQSAQTNSEKA